MFWRRFSSRHRQWIVMLLVCFPASVPGARAGEVDPGSALGPIVVDPPAPKPRPQPAPQPAETPAEPPPASSDLPPPENAPAPTAPAAEQSPAAKGLSPEQLAAVRTRVTDANTQTAGLLTQLAALDAGIYQTDQAILEGERQAAELEGKIKAGGEELARLKHHREELTVLWNKRARRIYKDSPGTAWAPLFSARTWSDLGRLKKLWRSLAQSHIRLVDQSSRVKEQILAHKAGLLTASEALTKQKEGLNAARQQLRDNRQTRTISLGQLRLAIGQAVAEQRAALNAQGAGIKLPHLCNPGSPVQSARLADLLDWYAPAAGPEPFSSPKFNPTGVVWQGQASWYGPTFEGCRASSGATYRSNQMTAASLTLPFGTFLKVTHAGKSAIVVITDRGPYVAGRELDLSQVAAQAVGLPGVGTVTMEVVLPAEPPPPFP